MCVCVCVCVSVRGDFLSGGVSLGIFCAGDNYAVDWFVVLFYLPRKKERKKKKKKKKEEEQNLNTIINFKVSK